MRELFRDELIALREAFEVSLFLTSSFPLFLTDEDVSRRGNQRPNSKMLNSSSRVSGCYRERRRVSCSSVTLCSLDCCENSFLVPSIIPAYFISAKQREK